MSSIEIIVPELPESVSDATIVTWYKKINDSIKRDEVIVDIETDKVILEIPAVVDGVLAAIIEDKGAIVTSQQIIGIIKKQNNDKQENTSLNIKNNKLISSKNYTASFYGIHAFSPSIRRIIAEYNLDLAEIIKNIPLHSDRITRKDIENYLSNKNPVSKKHTSINKTYASSITSSLSINKRNEKRVTMTRLRKRVAERLLETKNNTAMLTTFNEVNMRPIISLRKQYGESFEKRHGIRLGFMSFYIKAVVEALKRYPEINAFIDKEDIVYHDYFDVNIAISTPRGLVTPVLKDVEIMHISDIEKKIKELAVKGNDGKLTVEELTGGNFTITNGGIFGSLMSTPIINPPQGAILGMHAIKDRPIAIDGKVKIEPMMYLALSYDHRLIDGRESVGALVVIKEILEDPSRLLLDV